jgi:hypothetical protein
MYLRYAALVVVSILADLLNYALAPVAVLFASDDGWLPRWLSWLQTPDNSLDGDGGWRTEHRPYLVEDSKAHRWWNRTRWLYRNSMYGFAIDVLGAKTLPTDTLAIEGDQAVSNRPLHNGLVRRYIVRDGKVIYFQWYFVRAWSATRCVRINLGWKLWSFRPGEAINCQLVFSPSPFMGHSK